MSVLAASKEIVRGCRRLRFADPVAYVYNPLEYAWATHARYLEQYGDGRREIVLLGMNPGPYGMVQTGVPFGEIELARDWLGIEGPVGKPKREHPKRPILGFECTRSEVSGKRLWGWAQERFGTPKRFFRRFFVHNYCPLAFMAESGRNITPDKLPAAERDPLFALCNDLLEAVVQQMQPRMVIGIGAFAEKRARDVLAEHDVAFGRMPHPSPASPIANRGWAPAAEAALAELGIDLG